jgi:tetratricopeptide (TPR) repeat protein
LSEAIISYDRAIEIDSNYFNAYNNRGVVFHDLNLFIDALHDYDKAIELNPFDPEAWSNRGITLQKLNRIEESIASYDRAIEIKPDYADAYLQRGIAFQKFSCFEEALLNFERAIEIKPDYAQAHFSRGNTLSELKRLDEALAGYESAININPNFAEAYYNRGNALKALDRLDEAIASYDKAIELNPNYAEAFSNRGVTLSQLKLFDEALASYNKAIEINPDYVDALSNRGNTLGELKRLDEAMASYDRAIEVNPNYAEAYLNRGNILIELMRHDEALSSHEQAIKIKPDYAEAFFNQGVLFGELKKIKQAIENYEKSISINPYYAEAYCNKAMLLLMTDKFNDGWFFYKWRWNIKEKISNKLYTIIPNWDGQTDGKSIKILFWGEQGIGDEIFYFGMLKNFTNIIARITVTADKRLHSLFKRSMPEVEFIDRNNINTECNENSFDYQAPIGDIGQLYSVDPLFDIKLPKPFLHINKFRYSDFKKNHIFKDKVVCGLSWKSSNQKIGLSKSLDLIDLSPLLLIENVEFVSLQYGSTKDEIDFVENKIGKKIHTVDDLDIYNDIDGLVSLISDCDFVVTTSNVTAHLTGAIGKKGMVLLPFSKGKIWYWHSGEGQSVWYPSLQLTSQIQMNDWTDPIIRSKEWVLDQIYRK